MLLPILLVGALTSCDIGPSDLIVNTAGDGADVAPGDGVCEKTVGVGDCGLRAAIDEANALPGAQKIEISTGVDPVLALPGQDDTNAAGDLDVTDTTIIRGGGNTVDAGHLGRVFDLAAAPDAPDLTIRDLHITGGDATSGAAIRVGGATRLTLQRSSVTGNEAVAGSVIFVGASASASLLNTTVSGNTADGGAALESAGTTQMTFATVTANRLGTGAALRQTSGSFSVTASIVAAQTSGADCAGVVASGGYNVESASSCGFAATGDIGSTDPELTALLPDGAHRPLLGSPAIDRVPGSNPVCGTVVSDDQRQAVRPQGAACDTGSVEVLPGGSASITGTITDAGTAAPLGGVDVEIVDAGGEPIEVVDSGPTGAYVATGLPAGTYTVHIADPTGVYQDEWHLDAPNLAGATPVVLTTGASVVADASLVHRTPEHLGSLGVPGTGPGQFSNPFDVAVNSVGEVFVSDAGNDRVQRFASDGSYLGTIGGAGSGAGALWHPAGIAIDDQDRIIVADQGNTRVVVFDTDGQFAFDIPTGYSPIDVAVGGDGDIWYTRLTELILEDITFSPIARYDIGTGSSSEFVVPGYPTLGIAIDPAGTVWLSQPFSNAVRGYDQTPISGPTWPIGDFISAVSYPSCGGTSGLLSVDPRGNLLATQGSTFAIADCERVHRIDPTGPQLTEFGQGPGSGPTELLGAVSVAVDRTGRSIVVDMLNDRLQLYR